MNEICFKFEYLLIKEMSRLRAEELLNTSEDVELSQTSEEIAILRNFIEKTPFANRHSFGKAPHRLRNIGLARIS